MYLCISVPSQTAYIPLLTYYLPAFNEPFPLDYTFSIVGVASCVKISPTDAYLYAKAGWTDVEVGRAYGCHLVPPVIGTISPCTCPVGLTCQSYAQDVFTPPGLDIGRCVCCQPWVLAIAGILGSAFYLGLLYLVYAYV
jgi:hypothetical protein